MLRKILEAEDMKFFLYRCSLFLLDRANQDLVAAVFDSDLATEKARKPLHTRKAEM